MTGRAASTLGPLGLKYYEIWNEANTPGFFLPAPNVAQYLKKQQNKKSQKKREKRGKITRKKSIF
jgi:hypothetical protein